MLSGNLQVPTLEGGGGRWSCGCCCSCCGGGGAGEEDGVHDGVAQAHDGQAPALQLTVSHYCTHIGHHNAGTPDSTDVLDGDVARGFGHEAVTVRHVVHQVDGR